MIETYSQYEDKIRLLEKLCQSKAPAKERIPLMAAILEYETKNFFYLNINKSVNL